MHFSPPISPLKCARMRDKVIIIVVSPFVHSKTLMIDRQPGNHANSVVHVLVTQHSCESRLLDHHLIESCKLHFERE